jgi:hypothetical protein
VVSACPFCIWLALLSLPFAQSLVTSLLYIVEINLLATCPVISACSISSSSSSTIAFSSACCYILRLLLYFMGVPATISELLSLGGSIYGACCRSSSFAFATYLSSLFLFHLCSHLLRLRRFLFPSLSLSRFIYYAERNYSSSSLSSSSFAMVLIAGGTATEHSADPDELIVSFGAQ